VTSVEGETGGVSVSERFFDRLSGFGWIIAGGVILFIFLVAVINMLGRRPYK